MRFSARFCMLCMLLVAAAAPAAQAQRATVTGTITDAATGDPLPGASVVLSPPNAPDLLTGVATDEAGRYTISGAYEGTYLLTVTYVGYRQESRTVALRRGEETVVDVALREGDLSLNDVIVSASRQAEKVLDAPASVSVLDLEDIQTQQNGISSDVILRNTVGVDASQTGVDRREIVMRGFNNAFSGSAYVLTDYRQAAVPSLGVNVFSLMPNPALDLERIEVVRGPGSALYGAGVDAGVIHFITKDPFSHPGTAFSITGGERSVLAGELRHAGVLGERFGYKITGSYAQANDWALNPDDALDQAQLEADLDGVERNNDYQKYNANLSLQYRFTPTVALTGNVGHSSLDATVLSGIGTLQADGFGYTYGQLRFQAGSFFAQTFVNRNDAGNSFVYGTGQRVVDNSTEVAAQAQYNLGLWAGRQQFIFGADADLVTPETEGTILGRNEDETVQEYGAYVQSETQITSKLDLTLALRSDYNNIVEEVRLSPRAALVYRLAPAHSVRATYNRAFSSPGTNSQFLDIVAGTLPGSTPIRLRGRGSAFGFTFDRNPQFAAIAGTDLVASSLNPAALGAPTPAGLPLDATYASVYAGLAAIPDQTLAALASQALGREIPVQVVSALKFQLDPTRTSVQGFSRGQLMLLNPTTRQVVPISGLVDVEPLKETTSQTYELGYKGVFGNRLLFSADFYYADKKNFIGPLAVETPFVFTPNLATDLSAGLVTGIEGNAQLAAALAQFGLTPAQIAGVVVGLAQQNASFPDKPGAASDLPVAIVQPRENNAGPGNLPELLLSYRNFGHIQYYGADFAAQFAATDALDLFGNLSIVSDDFFDNEELDEEGTDLAVALNAPTLKAKAGFDYTLRQGFNVNASGRYTEGFPVRSGPYVGDVESYFLLDLGAGYDFARYAQGLRLDVTVQNVLDNDHREFVGAPRIGRLALARLTYTLP